MANSNAPLQILILFMLILINAFFAASEIAIISLNDQKIRRLAESGDKKARLLYNLVKEPSKFLATIQVGVTLAGLLASAVASQSFAEHLAQGLVAIGLKLPVSVINLISLFIITMLLSYCTLVLGELVPKRIGMQQPEQVARIAVSPLTFISRLSAPFVRLLSISTNFMIRLFGGDPSFNEENITEEEIRLMVDVGQEKGVIERTEKEMINNIFEFDDTHVSQIMTHRTAIVGLPVETNLDKVLEITSREKFSRFPVYQDSIDHIVGVLHVKDLIPTIEKSTIPFSLKKIMRPPYFVPTSKKTDVLLKELQKAKTHLAVIIDEYGGTAGIVTIEDLLEEIVGNIFDEHDEDKKEIEKIDQNTYLIDGITALDKVKELFKIELPLEDYDTIGGFIMGQLGRIPREDEQPVLEYQGIIFTAEKVEDKRITLVKAVKPAD